MITKTYTLEEINQGYADMRARKEHPGHHRVRLARRRVIAR